MRRHDRDDPAPSFMFCGPVSYSYSSLFIYFLKRTALTSSDVLCISTFHYRSSRNTMSDEILIWDARFCLRRYLQAQTFPELICVENVQTHKLGRVDLKYITLSALITFTPI